MFWRRKQERSHSQRHAQGMLTTLYVMASMVEARDPYTGGHLWRVSQYSRLVAEKLSLPPADIARIGLGGFLHDLGKVGVPDDILRKPGKLTDEEYAVIKAHPEVGMRVLSGHPLSSLVEAAIIAHHETPDGRGYPKGLSGSDVPLDARIVGVCDAFDAMTSHRPYRAGMPQEKALQIIESNAGGQFDLNAADALLMLAKEGALSAIIGHTDDGIPLQECPACGPTIVIKREQHPGDLSCCRSCGNEVSVEKSDGKWAITPTGRMATKEALAPDADNLLIEALVESVLDHLKLPQTV